MINIVLLTPEIPQNTGNIARTCAATKSRLHLIEPLGFQLSDKYLKRAGLDYWHLLDLTIYSGMEDFYEKNPFCRPYMASTKAQKVYSDMAFSDGDYILFGCETKGLPEAMIKADYERAIRVPMDEQARSLNLSNSVAVVLYEALRQLSFPGLQNGGVIG